MLTKFFWSIRFVLIFFGIALLVYSVILLARLQVVIEWETASEIDTVGFQIYRSLQPDGPFEKITSDPIPASADALAGGSYRFLDRNLVANQEVYYRLVEIESTGNENILGETSVIPERYGWFEAVSGFILIIIGLIFTRLSSKIYGKP